MKETWNRLSLSSTSGTTPVKQNLPGQTWGKTIFKHLKYFVGIGAQKAGTTWLRSQLVRHPQVGVPENKELHYFDKVCDARSPQLRYGVRFAQRLRNDIATITP